MRKSKKKVLFMGTLLILLLLIGFSLSKSLDGQSASLKDSTKEEASPDSEKGRENKEEKIQGQLTSTKASMNNLTEVVEEENKENEGTSEIEVTEEELSFEDHSVSTKNVAPSSEKTVDEPVESVKESSTTAQDTEEIAEEPETPKSTETIEPSSVGVTEYLLPFSNSEERIENITHAVLHFTSNALNNPNNPYLIEDTYNIFKDGGVSANYVIGRSGEIYLFVPENRVAYHAGKGQLQAFPEYKDRLNHYSIGIELLAIGTREEMIPMIAEAGFDKIDSELIGYTEAQYQSLNILLNDIVKRHPNIIKNRNHIVGHDDYAPDRKTDPGSLFNWSKIGL